MTKEIETVEALRGMDSAEHNAIADSVTKDLARRAVSDADTANRAVTRMYRVFLAAPTVNEPLLVHFVAGMHEAKKELSGHAADNMASIIKNFRKFMRWSHGSDIAANGGMTDAYYAHKVRDIPKVGDCTLESVLECFEYRPCVKTPDVATLVNAMVLDVRHGREVQKHKGRDAKAYRLATMAFKTRTEKQEEPDEEKVLDILEMLNTPEKAKGKKVKYAPRGSLFEQAFSDAIAASQDSAEQRKAG